VIDDADPILDLFQQILEEDGYEVVLSSYPMEGVQEVENINPDLVILDFMFRGKNLGWPMLLKLKEYPPTERIPIIVCSTAMEAVQGQVEYLASHGIPTVYKPFDIDELLETIRHVLVSSEVFLYHQRGYKFIASSGPVC